MDLQAASMTSSVEVHPETTTARSPNLTHSVSSCISTASLQLIAGWCGATDLSQGLGYPTGRRDKRRWRISGSSAAGDFFFGDFEASSSDAKPSPINSDALLHSFCRFCSACRGAIAVFALPEKILLTDEHLRYSEYSDDCVGVRRQNTTYSVFGGMRFALICAAEARCTNCLVMRCSSSPRAAPKSCSSFDAFLSRERSTGLAKIFLNCV
mmetsp:Transcript_11975/g.39810  ORF Transcript_11975/g.39810 Transcript_11975/m.39810 type:complete len:211 (-) Transcript_11975:910-1542(-)